MPHYQLLITLYFIFFAFVTWYRFHLGLVLLFLLLPTYLIRFHIGPLPTTLLEMMMWILFTIFIIRNFENWKSLVSNFKFQVSKNSTLFGGIFFFLLAATISVFTAVDTSRSEERRVGKECRSRWSP